MLNEEIKEACDSLWNDYSEIGESISDLEDKQKDILEKVGLLQANCPHSERDDDCPEFCKYCGAIS